VDLPISQISPQNWLSWQRPLSDHKTNERLMKALHMITNPENVKIAQQILRLQ